MLTVLLLGLIPVGAYVWIHNANNAAAQELEERLEELSLPPESELVDSAWAAERLAGAGNGMQYAGSLLIRSQLDIDELDAFYAGASGRQYVIATNDEGLGRYSLLFDAENDLEQPDLFMVIASGEPASGSPLRFDLRGH